MDGIHEFAKYECQAGYTPFVCKQSVCWTFPFTFASCSTFQSNFLHLQCVQYLILHPQKINSEHVLMLCSLKRGPMCIIHVLASVMIQLWLLGEESTRCRTRTCPQKWSPSKTALLTCCSRIVCVYNGILFVHIMKRFVIFMHDRTLQHPLQCKQSYIGRSSEQGLHLYKWTPCWELLSIYLCLLWCLCWFCHR